MTIGDYIGVMVIALALFLTMIGAGRKFKEHRLEIDALKAKVEQLSRP